MNAEIIAIGSELLTPFRQDTNSLYLTRRLNELGVEVIRKSIVGDHRGHLAEAVTQALDRADIVITMGGLGPTEDDLTRECVAEALGVQLKRDNDIVAELYARFAARRVKMTENNARQADVLAGAIVLPNDRGSAPGQWWQDRWGSRQKIVILLPGPPFELEAMFEKQCFERLQHAVPAQHIATRELRIALVGESTADHRAAPIYTRYTDVETTILAGAGEVQFHLRARSESPEEAEERVEELASELEEEFAEEAFASHGEKLEQIVGYYLQMRNATIAVAESCTGGLLAQRLTSVSGSSRYFVGGVVAYSNDMKTAFADVPPLMIAENGAVSKQVASALAEGIRKRCRATFGVGITGVAGPTGGTDEKPVGLVYVGVTDGKRTEVVERKFPGDRDRIRMWASQQALDMVRRRLV
ncbi:MAG TPA: competence/damage-inducible protein A [Clostridia bacterium]|nr:competence/damage-inducible protein A [Clostridia bacterium]